MATTTNEHLGEMRRRIDRLEVKAQLGSADAKSPDAAVHRAAAARRESARASAPSAGAAIDETLEQLDNELELAEHRVAAEFAATQDQFTDA
jgi:hypothetical protein